MLSGFLPINIKKMRHYCSRCNRSYKNFKSLKRHVIYECGQEPQFRCIVGKCNYRGKRKEYWRQHIISRHPDMAGQVTKKT